MAFPEGFIDEVRRTADIVRLVSDHVGLKKMGHSWKGLCPFHDEKTPSFNVRSEPPLFHCFGCGEGGDVFKFVMLHERAGFPEAVEQVARRFGVPVPENRYDGGPDRKQREEMLALLEAAADHFTPFGPPAPRVPDGRVARKSAGAHPRAALVGWTRCCAAEFPPEQMSRPGSSSSARQERPVRLLPQPRHLPRS
jgi:DNA primase